jgi:alkylation response protein AidB-like acyl-CoA dehydrogenase
VIVVAKTNPAAGAKGTSLLLVERGMKGFEKGKRLKKLGLKAQDTSELFFDNVRVPAENLLGGAGAGEPRLHLPDGAAALGAHADRHHGGGAAQAAIDWTVQYVKERACSASRWPSFQNTRYKLAELQTEVQVARVFVDKCLELVLQDKLDTATASMAKYWTSDLQCKVMDECVQLHGGYGYMWEYPITRAYADARVQRIYGGTNEIMKR